MLVLGAGGRLGALLRPIWAARPPAGIDLHFQSRGTLSGTNTHQWTPGQDPRALPGCDTVVALWGRTAGDAAALAHNAQLADHGRAVARACCAARLLHLSSAAIYGPADAATETTAPAPVTPYGQAKLAMETHIAGFRDPGLRHCCLRLANVVGADSLAPALGGSGPVTLDRFAGGHGPVRSYIGADDLAAVLVALARLAPENLPGTLNVAAHSPLAMHDLARAAGKEVIWRPAPADATARVTMDTARMARLLPQIAPLTDPGALIARWRAQVPPAG